MKLYFDLESTNLLNNNSINYTELPYKLKSDYRVHCLVAKDAATGFVYSYTPDTINSVKGLFNKATELVGHNIINFDMRVLQLKFGIDFEVDFDGVQDKVLGKPCQITDTLILSRLLNPDRFGGHSLDSWGKRVGLLKGDYGKQQEAWDVYTEDMLDYCKQDVEVTEATYKALMEEWGDWDWEDAYKTEKVTAYLVGLYEHVGFNFDTDLARDCLEELNGWMEKIEQDVEPRLPPKKMGKTSGKDFIPPVRQIKKDGTPTSYLVKFALKHGASLKKIDDVLHFCYKDKEWTLPMELEPIETHEPMRLANQKDMKEWLVSEGWVPTTWSDSDLTLDKNKQKVDPEKFKERVYRYCKESVGSPFARYRALHMKAKSIKEMYVNMIGHDMKRPLKVITSPKFVVNQDKDLCPNLEKLGEGMGFVQDVAKWLTYRHRRNAIQSPKGTGFLSHVKDDGRIPTPANSCGCSTSRFTHNVVCNIPRVTSLYGDKMRSLFGAGIGFQQIGYDFSGLEARVEGHYTMPFEGGEEYSEALLASKPADIHSVNAVKMGVTRDDAKTMKYAVSYGAQPNKLAQQMNWSLPQARQVFESFWEAALPLKMLKERVIAQWKRTGRKYIKGVDGRKLMVRSEHSILNMLFQSTGVIAAKKCNILHMKALKDLGLLCDPFKDDSFEGKALMMILYHDEGQLMVCDSLVDTFQFEEEDACKGFELEGKLLSDPYKKDGKWVRHYSHVGELASSCANQAAEYYKMNVELAADYIVGDNWKECH